MPKRLIAQFKSSDPFFLSDCLNVDVKFESLPKSIHGFYAKINDVQYIRVNKNLEHQLLRFVCAHELAHAVLHTEMNYYLLTENTFFNMGRFEREANIWAIRLLGYGHHLQEGESVKEFYGRIGIPNELVNVIPREWCEHERACPKTRQ